MALNKGSGAQHIFKLSIFSDDIWHFLVDFWPFPLRTEKKVGPLVGQRLSTLLPWTADAEWRAAGP